MRWLPAWLGEAYCALYPRLKGTLTVKDAAGALGVSNAKATLILSRLTRAGWAERLERGLYRAIEPSEVFEGVAAFGEIERNLAKVPQPEFAPPLRRFMELVVRKYGRRLVSAALFGSVARGDATPTSDVDVLLVIRGLPRKVGKRHDEFSEVKLRFYASREHELPANPVSPLLYTPEEARDFHDVYLDMTLHAVVLFDRGGLLSRRLAELSNRLSELESERHELDGKPVWILAPHLQRGEVATIE